MPEQNSPNNPVNSGVQVPPAADTSIDTFIQEVQQPTMPAQTFTPAQPGAGPASAQPQGPPPYTPPKDTPPIFDSEPEPALQNDGPMLDKVKTAAADRTLKALLNFENYLSAMGFGFYAGTDEIDQFKRKEAVTDELVQAFPEKYKNWVYSHFPEITAFAGIYLIDKVEMRNIAVKIRKVNKANAAAAKDAETMGKVSRATASSSDAGIERGNFTLYSDGYYAKNRRGEYIRDRASNKHLLERPDIKDLDKILEVKANRNRQILAAAFGWKESDFEQYNIPE